MRLYSVHILKMQELITSADGVFSHECCHPQNKLLIHNLYVKMQELITIFAANGIAQNILNRVHVFC